MKWLLVACTACCGPGIAMTQVEPSSTQQAIDACRVLDDAERRLECYDRIPGAEVTGAYNSTEVAQSAPPGAGVDAEAKSGATPNDRSRMMRHWELDDVTDGGLFRVRRHNPVYLLPARWSSSPNEVPFSPTLGRPENPDQLDAVEAKFQLSLKTKLLDNLVAGNGDVWVGFTQQSSWQAFNSVESEPFRETNYAPEIFTTWNTGVDLAGWRWQLFNLGFMHQSNGRSEPLSRSWNRVYAEFGFERNDWEVYVRPWLRVDPGSRDDNPDIEEFLGHGDLRVVWHRGRHDVELMTRFAPDEGRGAVQIDWHYPLRGDLKAYLQIFHGYGETLIDYNHRQTTVGLGVSLVQ